MEFFIARAVLLGIALGLAASDSKAALAQTNSSSDQTLGQPQNLPLGLDSLYWGMSAQDAKKLLPGLQLSAVTVNSALDSAVSPAAGRTSYRYGACAFLLALNFHRDRLDAANLGPRGSANLDCKRFIARRLNQQFGMIGGHLIPITPDAVFSPPSGQSGGNTTATHMVYFFRGDGIRFHP